MRFGKLRLGLGVGDETTPPPTDIAWAGSHTIAENSALGVTVGGALSATDPSGLSVTYSLTDDSNGYFSISGTSIIVTRVLDYEEATSHNITVRATNSGGATYDEVFAITVSDVSETPPDDPPPDPEVIDDGTFTNPPIVTDVDGAVKVHGKKGGVLGKFLLDLGPPEAEQLYTMHYDPDFSLLTNTGKEAMVGFVFKNGNDFHMVGLKGDASTGLDAYQLSGDNKWNSGTGLTTDNAGDAAFGTQAGPNWIQLEIAEDGSTYTFRTSNDGSTWTDEYTDVLPSPFTTSIEATQFGPGAAFWPDDVGSFSIEIMSWVGEAAVSFPLDGLSNLTGAWSASRPLLSSYVSSLYTLNGGLVQHWHGQVSSRNFTQGTAGNRPLITASGPNSRDAIDFAGVDEWMNTSGIDMTTFMSTAEGYYIVSFMPDDVSYNQSNVHDCGPIVSDASALHGIYIKKNSIQAMGHDGGARFSSADFINAGGVHTAEWWHVGGIIYFRLDGGVVRRAPCGTMSSLAAPFQIAVNRSINQFVNNVKIFEMAVFNVVPSLAIRDTLVEDFLGYIGGTPIVPSTDPHFANVVFLAGFDVGDNLTVNPYIEERFGAVGSWASAAATDTGIVLVGDGSALFSNGSLRFPDRDEYTLSSMNSDQFTIELKATTTTTTPGDRALIWKVQNAAAQISWALIAAPTTHQLRFQSSTIGTSYDIANIDSSGLTWATGTTYDIAVDKDSSGKIRIYRNGVMVASATPANSAFFNGTAEMAIGCDNQDIKPWAGTLDEIRITVGVARYASDSGYTPTAGKFPRARASASAWVPTSVTSLRLWYKMDEVSGVDGASISSLTDASGYGNNASQPSPGNVPKLDTAEIDGKNVIRYGDGANMAFDLPTNMFSGWTAGTVIALFKCVADPGTGQAGAPLDLGSSTEINHHTFLDGTLYDSNFSTVRKNTGNPSFTLTSPYTYCVTSINGAFNIYINDALHYNTATNTFGGDSTPSLGRGSPSEGYFNGWSGEVLIFNEVLTTINRQKAAGYLSHKWGTEANLAMSHPYKDAPP